MMLWNVMSQVVMVIVAKCALKNVEYIFRLEAVILRSVAMIIFVVYSTQADIRTNSLKNP